MRAIVDTLVTCQLPCSFANVWVPLSLIIIIVLFCKVFFGPFHRNDNFDFLTACHEIKFDER